MVNKNPTMSELVGDKSKDDKSKNLSPTHPEPDETPKEADKTEVERIRDTIEGIKGEKKDRAFRENSVENFDNSGNGKTDNMPLDWDTKAPSGTVVYGPTSTVPSENAVVSVTASTAVYATENEFDDKGLKDPLEEVPPPEEIPPPEADETGPSAKVSSK